MLYQLTDCLIDRRLSDIEDKPSPLACDKLALTLLIKSQQNHLQGTKYATASLSLKQFSNL
jgi:hypothetical protein